jgi:hypothetical protein
MRAVLGLLATAADEAKHLPDRAIELPMLAVSSALQISLRAQQRYARLAARGDDVINRRPPGDEPPPWATFDEPVATDNLSGTWSGPPADEESTRAASQLLDEILSMDGLAAGDPSDAADEVDEVDAADEPVDAADEPVDVADEPAGAASKPAPKRLAAVPDPVSKPVKPAPAKQRTAASTTSTAAKKSASKKTATKKAADKAATAKKNGTTTAAKKATPKNVGKTINKPRHTTPSRFDTVDDD